MSIKVQDRVGFFCFLHNGSGLQREVQAASVNVFIPSAPAVLFSLLSTLPGTTVNTLSQHGFLLLAAKKIRLCFFQPDIRHAARW